MTVSVMKIRNGKGLLPAIALITAALLLTGEWFSCCRINEAFAREIEQVAKALGLIGEAAPVVSAAEVADAHPHCHGPAAPAAPSGEVPALHPDADVPQGTPALAQDAHCLSEQAITRQSMVGSESLALESPPEAIALHDFPVATPFASVERPRPQNRSSPPVYLLTLRLLV
ncbi:MAG: hypothetical protein ABIW76_17860 [Fibrobacteria bacterium]